MTHQLFSFDDNHSYHHINQGGQDLFVLWSQQIDMVYKRRSKLLLATQHRKKSVERKIAAVICLHVITWLCSPKMIVLACFLLLLQCLIATKLHFMLENAIWFQNLTEYSFQTSPVWQKRKPQWIFIPRIAQLSAQHDFPCHQPRAGNRKETSLLALRGSSVLTSYQQGHNRWCSDRGLPPPCAESPAVPSVCSQ